MSNLAQRRWVKERGKSNDDAVMQSTKAKKMTKKRKLVYPDDETGVDDIDTPPGPSSFTPGPTKKKKKLVYKLYIYIIHFFIFSFLSQSSYECNGHKTLRHID